MGLLRAPFFELTDSIPFPEGGFSGETTRDAQLTFEGAEFFTDRYVTFNQILYRIPTLTTSGAIVIAIYQSADGSAGSATLVTSVTRSLSAAGVFADNCASDAVIAPGRFFVLIGRTSGVFTYAAFTNQSLSLFNGSGYVPSGLQSTAFTTTIPVTTSPPGTFANTGSGTPTSSSVAPLIRFKYTTVPVAPSTFLGSALKTEFGFVSSGNTLTGDKWMQINNVGPGAAFNFQPQSADPTFAPTNIISPWGLQGGLFSPRNQAINPAWMVGNNANASGQGQFGASTPFTILGLFVANNRLPRLAIAQRDAALLHGFGGYVMILLNDQGLRFRVDDGSPHETVEIQITNGNLHAFEVSHSGAAINCRVNGADASPVPAGYPGTQNDPWNLGAQAFSAGINFFDGIYFRLWGINRLLTTTERALFNLYLQYNYANASTDYGVPPPAVVTSAAASSGALQLPMFDAFPYPGVKGQVLGLNGNGRMYEFDGGGWREPGARSSGPIGRPRGAFSGGTVRSPFKVR